MSQNHEEARQLEADMVAIMEELSDIWRRLSANNMRRKPILGGPFSVGRFSLCSVVVTWDGLHRVDYFVEDDASHLNISCGPSRAEALANARRILSAIRPSTLNAVIARRVHAAKKAEEEAQRAIHQERELLSASRQRAKVRSIPRRRKAIFEASDGKCHYCSTPLTLDGKWHIEHKMPKALMGGNEPGNLVASCAPCNFKKRDRTDAEFIAGREALRGHA